MGCYCLMRRVLVWKDEKVPEMEGDDGYKTGTELNATEL